MDQTIEEFFLVWTQQLQHHMFMSDLLKDKIFLLDTNNKHLLPYMSPTNCETYEKRRKKLLSLQDEAQENIMISYNNLDTFKLMLRTCKEANMTPEERVQMQTQIYELAKLCIAFMKLNRVFVLKFNEEILGL